MHREILSPPPYLQVDHKNRNKLDNRRSSNLRIATHEDNARNKDKFNGEFTSQYKGVSWNNEKQIWCCSANKYIGIFRSELAAANAYNEYARKNYGEFTVLNECPILEDWESYKVKQYSSYVGVSWNRNVEKWIAFITDDSKKRRTLGYFDNELQAANCYNHWAKLYHRENAVLNNCEYVKWEKDKKKTSKYNGVCYKKKENRWEAYVTDPSIGRQVYVGRFETELDAAKAYNIKAIEIHGENYTKLNIIE